MIFDGASLKLPARLRADACVLGSGPGGAAAAMRLSEAGLKVVVLELGAFIPPEAMTQREAEMLPRLFLDGGAQTNTRRTVRIHQGKGVGGSSLHNLNLCKKIPPAVLAHWAREGAGPPPDRLAELYAELETMLAITPVPQAMWSTHNRLLASGAERLGWRWGGLSHNRTGCLGSGFCETGCRYDAKNNAAKVLVPRIVAAGGELVTGCRAERILHEGGRVLGVEAVVLDPGDGRALGTLTVEADIVCVSMSATRSPAILRASNVPDPSRGIGHTLAVHPAVVVAALMPEPVRAWEGIPQGVECTQWLDFDAAHGQEPPPPRTRTWIVPAFAHPVGTATMMPGWGRAHRERMAAYPRLAVLTAMIHDRSPGSVRPAGAGGASLEVDPTAADLAELASGAEACAELLFAAGAEKVLLPGETPVEVGRGSPIPKVRVEEGRTDLVAVHPMASIPMGEDPDRYAVDPFGRVRGLEGLWVADGSLFPSSIGVPPQWSIYALGLLVGDSIVRADPR